MSALLNGRSQANALPATCQLRLPRCRSSPSVTSGSSAAKRATSSKVCTNKPYCGQGLPLPVEQRVGVVVQDRRLLVIGEAEFRDAADRGERIVDGVVAAEDDAVDAHPAQHPGELLGERAARQHRGGYRDIDPDVPPPLGVTGDDVVDEQLREAGAVRVGEDEP